LLKRAPLADKVSDCVGLEVVNDGVTVIALELTPATSVPLPPDIANEPRTFCAPRALDNPSPLETNSRTEPRTRATPR
jgi:hypothetical protein